MLKRVGESRHPWCTPTVVRNVVAMVDCAGRLVVEAFYSSDQVVIYVIQPHGRPQSCMPNSVKHLEVHEDMVKVLLVLQVFLTECSKIENLLSCAPSSFLLWRLPVLLWWSPHLVAVVYSGEFLAWPYLDDWSGWQYGSLGIDVGCLSLGEWWSGTESKVLATLLSARTYCRWWVTYLLWPLLLPGPAPMECCLLLPTCLSSVTRARAGQNGKSPWRGLHSLWHADQCREDPADEK